MTAPAVEVPKQFRRDTLEESFAALLGSYGQAQRKISEQGAEIRQLREEARRKRRWPVRESRELDALKQRILDLESENVDLHAQVADFMKREEQAVWLAVLANTLNSEGMQA